MHVAYGTAAHMNAALCIAIGQRQAGPEGEIFRKNPSKNFFMTFQGVM